MDARSPPPSSPLQRRAAVLARVLEGASLSEIANRFRISLSTAHNDVLYLEKVGALRRLSARGARVRFEPGPRCGKWLSAAREAQVGGFARNRWGRSGSDAALGLPVRVHHWRWSRAFGAGPARDPPWTGENEASGVVSRWLVVEDHGEGFTVRAYFGKRSRRLMVAAPEVIVDSALDVLAAEDRMRQRVQLLGSAFAKRYGFELHGEWRQSHPTEYGGPRVPGLRPFGRPGIDDPWADDSPGEGETEIETRRVPLAAAWADLPAWEKRTEDRLLRLEKAAAKMAERLERALAVLDVALAPLVPPSEVKEIVVKAP